MILMGPVGLSLLAAAFAAGVWHSPHVILPVLFNPIFAAATGFFLLTGTVYGVAWAADISALIARLRGDGKYDLLILSPAAPLLTTWALCTGCLYRDHAFKRISQQRLRLTRIALMLASAFVLPLSISVIAADRKFMVEVLSLIVHLLALTMIFQIDHMQSSVIGCLVGLNIPYYTRGSTHTRLLAGSTFLALQITSYLIVWLAGVEMLPALYALAAMPETVNIVSLPLMYVTVFALTRETIILVLWQILLHRLQSEQPAVDVLVLSR